MNIHRILLLLLILAFYGSLSSQPEGREFWYTCGTRPHYVTTSDLADSSDSALVYILGHQACTGYVQNPFTSFYVPFEVHPDSLTTVSIPANELFFGELQELIPAGQILSAPLQGGRLSSVPLMMFKSGFSRRSLPVILLNRIITFQLRFRCFP